MKRPCRPVFAAAVLIGALLSLSSAQDAKPAPKANAPAEKPDSDAPPAASPKDTADGKQYSGTYSFLKEGEYVQITVEDAGTVTGFISRYGENGAFVDQFFKSGKLDGGRLSFITSPLNAAWFEFAGTVERGEGKSPSEEAYYVLKGTLTERTTQPDKKVTAHAQEVTFRMLP